VVTEVMMIVVTADTSDAAVVAAAEAIEEAAVIPDPVTGSVMIAVSTTSPVAMLVLNAKLEKVAAVVMMADARDLALHPDDEMTGPRLARTEAVVAMVVVAAAATGEIATEAADVEAADMEETAATTGTAPSVLSATSRADTSA